MVLIFIFLLGKNGYVQNAVVGSGFSTGWGSACVNNSNFKYFTSSAGSSYILTTPANGLSNQYFRVGIDWGGTVGQYNTTGSAPDVQAYPNTEYTLSSTCTSNGALYFNVASTSHNYIFKTKDAGSNPGFKLIVFRVEGTVQTSSSATTPSGAKYPGESYTVTATTTGTSTGQGFYLRYTTDNFASSTILAMTGSGTNYTATIPGSAHTAGATIQYYILTSGDGLTISHGNADWYTINLGSTYSYTVAASSVSLQDGNWSNPETWMGGSVPPDFSPVTINHTVTLDQDATVSSLTINSGKKFIASDGLSRILTISSNTAAITLNNSGTWDNGSGTSTVVFSGNAVHTISGTTGFYNVITNTGINFGSASTIINTFQINSNGFVSTNAPYYGNTSTLIYNTGSEYEAATEWYANFVSGQGVPQNVQIGTSGLSGSGLRFGTNTLWRRCNGNLTIGSSSGSGYGFKLSTNAGGDVKVGGNWTRFNTGAFIPNGRSVWLSGSATQSVTVEGGGTEVFSFLIVENTSSVILNNTTGMATDISIDGNNTGAGDQLQLLASGSIDLNGRTIYLAGTPGGNLLVSGGVRQITGGSGSTLKIQSSKTVISAAGGTLVTGDQVIVCAENTASSTTDFNVGSNLTTINGTLLLNNGYKISRSPAYGPNSLLKYNSGGTPTRGEEWMTATGFGYPNDVQISNNTTLDPGGLSLTGTVLNLARDLTIDANSNIYMDYSAHNMTVPLVVGQHVNISGNLVLSNTSGGDLKVGGNWTHLSGTFTPHSRAVFFNGVTGDQTVTCQGGETFDYLILDKTTSGDLLLANDITINQVLTLSKGLITTGSNKVTLTTTGSIVSYSSNSYVNGILAQTIPAAGPIVFPLGKGGNYRPLTFNYSTLSGISIVTAEQIEAPLSGTLPANVVLGGNRYWRISQDGGSSFNYNLTLDPTGFYIPGTVLMLKKESGTITGHATTSPNYTNSTDFNTLTGNNEITLGMDCSGVISNAGNAQSFCVDGSAVLSANVPSPGTGIWSVISGPDMQDSQFSDVNDPGATFTPSGGAGAYVLRWTVTNPPCTPATSEVTIKVNPKPATGAIYHD